MPIAQLGGINHDMKNINCSESITCTRKINELKKLGTQGPNFSLILLTLAGTNYQVSS